MPWYSHAASDVACEIHLVSSDVFMGTFLLCIGPQVLIAGLCGPAVLRTYGFVRGRCWSLRTCALDVSLLCSNFSAFLFQKQVDLCFQAFWQTCFDCDIQLHERDMQQIWNSQSRGPCGLCDPWYPPVMSDKSMQGTVVGFHAIDKGTFEQLVAKDSSDDWYIDIKPMVWSPNKMQAISHTRKAAVKKLGITFSEGQEPSKSKLTKKRYADTSAFGPDVWRSSGYMIFRLKTRENLALSIASKAFFPVENGGLEMADPFQPFCPINLLGDWEVDVAQLGWTTDIHQPLIICCPFLFFCSSYPFLFGFYISKSFAVLQTFCTIVIIWDRVTMLQSSQTMLPRLAFKTTNAQACFDRVEAWFC